MPILIIKSFRTVNVSNKYILYLFIFQILGPMANNSNQLFGLYSADSDPKFTVTPLMGLSNLANNVTYTPGCKDGNKCSNYSPDDVQNAVKDANVVFVCLGTGRCTIVSVVLF